MPSAKFLRLGFALGAFIAGTAALAEDAVKPRVEADPKKSSNPAWPKPAEREYSYTEESRTRTSSNVETEESKKRFTVNTKISSPKNRVTETDEEGHVWHSSSWLGWINVRISLPDTYQVSEVRMKMGDDSRWAKRDWDDPVIGRRSPRRACPRVREFSGCAIACAVRASCLQASTTRFARRTICSGTDG